MQLTGVVRLEYSLNIGTLPCTKILKLIDTTINGTFTFALPSFHRHLQKQKSHFIRTIIIIMFHITSVRFILTNMLQIINLIITKVNYSIIFCIIAVRFNLTYLL